MLMFVTVAIATFRLSMALAGDEDGPWGICNWLRDRVGFLECFYCTSFWVAAGFTTYLVLLEEIFLVDAPIYVFALSGAAIAIDRWVMLSFGTAIEGFVEEGEVRGS
jgi:hypothetical protein